jgi:hypothetical protein
MSRLELQNLLLKFKGLLVGPLHLQESNKSLRNLRIQAVTAVTMKINAVDL